jgi:hypothetical protein
METTGYHTEKTYWLPGRKSELSINNELLINKTIIKPIWTYGFQLWGTTSNSNISMFKRFQSKAIRMISDAPWFVQNAVILRDL